MAKILPKIWTLTLMVATLLGGFTLGCGAPSSTEPPAPAEDASSGSGYQAAQPQAGNAVATFGQPVTPLVSGTDPQGAADSPPVTGSSEVSAAETPADQTLAVDVGNPKDTGPGKPVPASKIAIADAALSDGGLHLYVTVVGLRLAGSHGTPDVLRALTPRNIDLLDYAEGRRLVLLDAPLPPGTYSELAIQLAEGTPATFVDAGGNSHAVFVPPRAAAGGMPELYGTIGTVLANDGQLDWTLHVDLRRSLRPVDSATALLYSLAPGQYSQWLMPEQAAFAANTFGHAALLGLAESAATVICAYPAWPTGSGGSGGGGGLGGLLGGLLPQVGLPLLSGGDDRCFDAVASAAKTDGRFFLGYLPASSYRLRLYIGSTLYVELPALIAVVNGTTSVLDLSAVVALLP